MRKIMIIGCKGAGKSTLANEINRRTCIEILEYNDKIEVTEDENILENYIITRNRYIDYTISTLEKRDRGENKTILQIRGPETLYTYSVFSPYLKGKDWDMTKIMKTEFDHLKQYYSELVIMLDFDREVIEKRWRNDPKLRTNMEFWEKLWFGYERPYLLKSDNLVRITDANMSVGQCAEVVIQVLKDKGYVEF